jgi:predicted RNA-binding Zn ribbon-like protein
VSRHPAIFVGDAVALDFLNSIATPVDTPFDWLADGAGLLDWLGQADLVPADVLKAMRQRTRPHDLDKVASQARELREWFRGFVRAHKGRPLTAAALARLDPVNRLLERDDSYSRIVSSAGDAAHPLEVRRLHRWKTPDALLLPVAEALAALVAGEDFTQVKACEGPGCTLLFADHTRAHARRWCSMALCGNRAKQAAHRERLKADKH